MDEEYVHPCDVRLGDVIEWHEADFKVVAVQRINKSRTRVTWQRLRDKQPTGPMIYKRESGTLLRVISRGMILIEEDLTPADVG